MGGPWDIATSGDFFIAYPRRGLSLKVSFLVTTAMIVLTSCLRATYASGRPSSGLLNILLNLPVLRRLERGIRVVTGKDTETPSGCGVRSARAAGAMSALLPFHFRGKHPQREQRALRSTPSSNINCPNELISFRFGSPSSQSRRTLPQLLIPSAAFRRQLQNHPRAPQAGRSVG